MPIYDEYEDEYLDVIPKKPVVNSVISRPLSEENQTVIQSQKDEKREDNECAEGDYLPLCYSSLELIRKRLTASKHKHKFEDMGNFMDFLKLEDDEDEQSCIQYQLIEK